jgi:hypothetical protein
MARALDAIEPAWERRMKLAAAAVRHLAPLRPGTYMDRLEKIYRETIDSVRNAKRGGGDEIAV